MIRSGSPSFMPPRRGSGHVVVVLHHECGGTTAHALPDGEELAALTRERSEGVEIRAYVYPIEKI